ncbi:MAG: DMT family transporter [Rickettsiales bacterium]|nr:MAG: DMT family transporter [Rickettsiales bacterium]
MLQKLSFLGLLFAAFVWGISFVLMKNSLDILPPMYLLGVRFFLSFLLLGVIYCKKFALLSKDTIKCGSILGIFLFFAYTSQTIGLSYTTAGKNAFITASYIIFTPLIEWIFVKKKTSKKTLIAIFLTMFGIGLLCLDDNLSVSLGDFLTLICGVCYAFHFFYIDRYSKQDTILLLLLQFFVVGLLSFIIAPIYHSDFNFNLSILLDKNIMFSLSFLVVFCSFIGFFLQMTCQKYVPPTIAGIVLSLESVFGILSSIIFLGEQITLKILIGCILIFTSIVLVNINFEKK